MGGFPPQQAPVATLSAANVTMLLSLAVTLLGLINYFIGFSEEASPADGAITYLLASGLLAALRILPRGPKVLPFVAMISVFGALEAIVAVVRTPVSVPGVVTVILILGILQMLVAVATLLLDYGLLKLPAQQQHHPYGQPYGQFGQPTQGAGEQKAGPSGNQFGPPAVPPSGPSGQTPQSTVYAPQQGQFYQPPSDSGPPQQQPPAGGSQS
jgi:hypothetical protein